MGVSLSVGSSVHHLACETAGSSFPYYLLSPGCVWELATTRSGFAIVLGLAFILAVRYSTSPWRHVPPGPRGLPLVGNVLEVRDKDWLFHKDLKQKYVSRQRQSSLIAEEPFILVALASLWLKKSLQVVFYLSILNHVEGRWRRSRRAAHQGLTKLAVRNYHSILRKEGVLLTSALLANPGASEKHFQRAATSATMSILYDYPTLGGGSDKNLNEIFAFTERLSTSAGPGAYLVELFPWMLHIPERFAKWKYEGNRDFTRFNNLFESLFDRVLKALGIYSPEGSERPSLSASIFKSSEQNQLSHQEMSWLSGTLFTAGAETTSTTMNWWALAMIAHPEVQKPIVKEVLRWRPALPFAVPHSTMEDDWYNGMFIPKGTICLTNLLQCNRDSYYGDDPVDFRPERFLGAHGELLPGPSETREEGHGSYGFGKRACVGKHMANESLFIYIATTLWAVTLERACDKDGNEVHLEVDAFVDTGMTLKPVPYECRVTPRFSEVASILAAEEELLKA
ncbi:cytochrome P450 [Lactarius indigo]|nr:cytochrome P450 [Lactarius indigo]